jgi:catecholate siderophore receptor
MRNKEKKHPGRPPRWLVWSAMTASTFGGAAAAGAVQWPYRDLLSQALPARRFESDDPGQKTRQRQGGAVQTQDTPVLRFDIPAGLLPEALAAYEKTTGVRVEIRDRTDPTDPTDPISPISGIASPGVSGLLTAEQALDELLAGTGVTYRFADALTVALEVQWLAETVDVTASPAPSSPKYTEPLRDTPQTLTVVPRQVMEEQNATTLRDVLRNVTGISIQAGEGGGGVPGDNLSIRGFNSTNDIFVDGVRDFGAYSRDPYNLDRVEVSKGPASLFSGHGSTGGAVNLVTKAPSLETANAGAISAGSAHYGRATVDLNQPLAGIPNAALRINAMWTAADTPGRDAVESQRWGLAPSLAFGLGTPTRLSLSYSRLDQDNLPDYGIPWVPATNVALRQHANQPAPVDFDTFYGLTGRDYEKTSTGLATATLDHDFNDVLSLRSLLRHGASQRDSVITAPRFLNDQSTAIRRELQSRDLTNGIIAQQNNLTARFATGQVSHAVAAGTEVSRETGRNYLRSGPDAPTTNVFDPHPDDPYAGPITRTGARTESTAETAALYASDTVKLSERWELTGGLRFDRFDVDYKSVAVGGAVTPFRHTDEMLSWRAGVVHKPAPDGSVYLSAGTSFNPGAEGTTGIALTASTADLDPEKSRGYEAGTKWDFFGARLSMNAAVFETVKTNARTPGVNPGDPPTVLKGEQRIRGLELGLTGNLNSRWSTFFGYTWLNSEILKSNTAAERGSDLANSPEHSASLWTTYRLARGFELGGGVQYIGDRLNSATTQRLAPAYTLVDATAAYQVNQRLTLRLNVNNLTDERYIDRVGGGHFIPGAGRSVALTTALDF